MFAAKSNSNRNYRKLSFQNLESRQLMAGNVAVSVVNGDLLVTGDTAGNEVAIFQSVTQGQADPGRFFVSGINGTTINGSASGSYFTGVTRDIAVNLGAGGDHVTLGDGVNDFHFNVPRDLRINMGTGDDHVKIDSIAVGDDVSISTGDGRDYVDLHSARVGVVAGVDSGLNNLTVRTGNGVDIVTMRNAFVRNNLTVDAGTLDRGNDMVDLAIMDIVHDLNVITGDGRDTVVIDNVEADHNFNVNSGADIDNVQIKNSQSALMTVDLGAGTDNLQISDSFGGRAVLNGGAGASDRVFEHNVDFDNGQALFGFEPNVIQNF